MTVNGGALSVIMQVKSLLSVMYVGTGIIPRSSEWPLMRTQHMHIVQSVGVSTPVTLPSKRVIRNTERWYLIKKITKAWITPLPKKLGDPLPRVTVQVGQSQILLFDYVSDEISFSKEELIGLTMDEAHALKERKDKAYLKKG